MQTLVSAIIPTYNYGHYVNRAVDSVLRQTYAPIECIVVDDGSTDNTAEVLQKYGSRIQVIKQANCGLSAARNTGIKVARGECIAILDADDWWEPDKISLQMQALEDFPQVSAVGVGVRQVDRNLNANELETRPQPSGSQERDLRAVALRRLWVGGSGSGLLVRRGVFDSIGLFDTSLHAAEDWDMWLRLVSRFQLTNLSQILVNIHRHGTGTFRNSTKMEENQWRVYEKAIACWPDVLNPTTRRRMRALILADAGGELVSAGQSAQALNKYLLSLCAWPFHAGRWSTFSRLLAKCLASKFKPSLTACPGIADPKSGSGGTTV